MRFIYRKLGFTLIELIITIVLLGIVMIPLGIMSLEFMREIVYSRDSGVAVALARVELSKINNLSYSDPSLADGTDTTITSYEGYAYDLRRTVNFANSPTNTLKKVQIRVYPTGNTTQQLVNIITYIANVTFGAGSGGGAAGAAQANSLSVSGGTISGKNLIGVTLENTDTANAITITQMTISFTGVSGINLQKVNIGGATVFSGNANSGDTITLSPSATLAASQSTTDSPFLEFNKDLTSVTSLVFIMSDGSQTISYSF